MEQKTIVVSAVNIVVGGTLTILRDCLCELSKMAAEQNLRVVALVNNKELAYFDNIEYIEIPWSKKRWINRLWTEYVSMKKISKSLQPIHLWLSLHDTTPNVVAERRAVYCHNPFLTYKWRFVELFSTYKIVLFSIFTKYIYKVNIHKNNYVIVQQLWLKAEFKRMFKLDDNRIITATPTMEYPIIENDLRPKEKYQFFFPSSLNSHKNFEIVCRATEVLAKKGRNDFEVYLTIDNGSGAYGHKLVEKYRHVEALKFIGFQSRQSMIELYGRVDCLIFPSKIETWGLPISEFAVTGKPMLLADLTYAHTTSIGSKATAFFNPDSVKELASMMERLIDGETSFLHPVDAPPKDGLCTQTWRELIETLIKE